VTENKHSPSIWDGLSAFMWTLVFIAGLLPEIFFLVLRNLGHVTIHQAFINTPWFITFTCAGFLGWFTYQRSHECDDREDVAFGKAVQVSVLALAAFLPLQVEQIPAFLHITIPHYRNLIMTVILIKMASWIYLVQLIMRYHLFSGLAVFKNMSLIFPSARKRPNNGGRITPLPMEEKPTNEDRTLE
jgi:hypothetical protein